MSKLMGPFHDTNARFTAYMQGQSDYLEDRPMDHTRHGIVDEYRMQRYNDGWTQENLDHMEIASIEWFGGRK